MSKRTLLLLWQPDSYGWRVVDDETGYMVLEFSQAEYGRMWLRECGYQRASDDPTALDPTEVWTKEA